MPSSFRSVGIIAQACILRYFIIPVIPKPICIVCRRVIAIIAYVICLSDQAGQTPLMVKEAESPCGMNGNPVLQTLLSLPIPSDLLYVVIFQAGLCMQLLATTILSSVRTLHLFLPMHGRCRCSHVHVKTFSQPHVSYVPNNPGICVAVQHILSCASYTMC